MLRKFLMALSLCLCTTSPSLAQEWGGQITPYVWATGIKGKLTYGESGPTFNYDNKFSEVLKTLRGAFFISAYARKGDFVVSGDLNWASIAKSGKINGEFGARGKLNQTSLSLLAGQRVLDRPKLTLDALAGFRAWQLKSDIRIGSDIISASPEKKFVDPIIALRSNFAWTERLRSIFYIDYGGFGVGSKRTTQVVSTLNYEINDKFYISGGYRYLHVKYDHKGSLINVKMTGPLVGLTWRF